MAARINCRMQPAPAVYVVFGYFYDAALEEGNFTAEDMASAC